MGSYPSIGLPKVLTSSGPNTHWDRVKEVMELSRVWGTVTLQDSAVSTEVSRR
jgi:hypothetical protein